jgi:pimeloyl-ACP methyl ester carboxylesterase
MPAWFGGWCWKKSARLLRDDGHVVYTPTLTGLGERAHLANPSTGLSVHIEDIANVLHYEDLSDVILVGNSSAGMVISGVADQARTRIAQVVYLDAFVPEDGQSLIEILPPDRRSALEELVRTEGDGWLLPRFAAPPWEQFVPAAWNVTGQADLEWVLARLRPTPFAHFTDPVRRHLPDAEQPHRVYIRCRASPTRASTATQRLPGPAMRGPILATSHLPFVTDSDALHTILRQLSQ